MRSYHYLLTLCAFFLGGVFSLKAEDNGKADVVCFGDSITKRGYPQILHKLTGVKVINAGVAGHTSSQGLRRMEKDVLSYKPKVVVIAFATNDIRVDNKKKFTSLEKYEKNLIQMIMQCAKIKAKVVICTVPPINAEPYYKRHEKKIYDDAGGLEALLAGRRATVKSVAQKYKIPVVDLYSLLPNDPKWLSSDGVHPSPAGNEIIAKHVAEVVRPLLK